MSMHELSWAQMRAEERRAARRRWWQGFIAGMLAVALGFAVGRL